MAEITKEIIWAAIDFARVVRNHSTVPDECVDQMFDAFDPSLKRKVLMALLGPQNVVKVVVPLEKTSKIQAIKAVRQCTGWSLKEAKEFIEMAEMSSGAEIPKNLTSQAVNQLSNELKDTGYKVF